MEYRKRTDEELATESGLAKRIRDALNENETAPTRVDIPHDQDITLGPITLRYIDRGGPIRSRWYIIPPEDKLT